MKCPLLWIPDKLEQADCQREKCAWWVELFLGQTAIVTWKGCAIPAIALKMKRED